jgi:choline dehydrogenase
VAAFDYVVVGGGSAGAIVAARLAEDPQVTVCLLEAGPSDEGDARILEIARWAELAGSELVRSYGIEADVDANAGLQHSRAFVLGGCGSHNQAIAFTAPASDLRRWEELGASGWGPDGTRPYFERVLGRVHVEEAPPENECAAAFVTAAVEAGYPKISFENSDFAEGVGWLRLNVRDGLRQSSSVAYLHPLAERPPNLTIQTETTAIRLLVDGDRVTGVETTGGRVDARVETVVSCGALESPRLLMLSGIGPGSELERLGIPPLVDLPGVGENLLDHPEASVVWEASRPVPLDVVQNWESGLFARTDPTLESPDAMIHFGTMPALEGYLPPGVATAEHAFWMTPNVTRPTSVGRLGLRSADPSAPPILDFRYYTEPGDGDAMLESLRICRRLADTAPLRDWVKRELIPGPDARSDEELLLYARLHGTTVHHPAGTCRMGRADDHMAVVDPSLRVRGVQGLRIADASVFPAMLGVNPNLTCMMIGEKAADLIQRSQSPSASAIASTMP